MCYRFFNRIKNCRIHVLFKCCSGLLFSLSIQIFCFCSLCIFCHLIYARRLLLSVLLSESFATWLTHRLTPLPQIIINDFVLTSKYLFLLFLSPLLMISTVANYCWPLQYYSPVRHAMTVLSHYHSNVKLMNFICVFQISKKFFMTQNLDHGKLILA